MRHELVQRKDGTYRRVTNLREECEIKISESPITRNAAGGFIAATAEIDPSVEVPPTAIIGAGAIVEAGVSLGAYCAVGDNTKIFANSTLRDNCTLGLDNNLMCEKPVGANVIIGHQNTLVNVRASAGGEEYFIGADSVIGDNNRLHFVDAIGTEVMLGDGNRDGSGLFIGAYSDIGSYNLFEYKAFLESSIKVKDHVRIDKFVKVFRDCVLLDEVELDFGAVISSKCVLEAKTRVGFRSFLGHSATLGAGAQVGKNCNLKFGVDLGAGAVLSDYVKLPARHCVRPGEKVTSSVRVAGQEN